MVAQSPLQAVQLHQVPAAQQQFAAVTLLQVLAERFHLMQALRRVQLMALMYRLRHRTVRQQVQAVLSRLLQVPVRVRLSPAVLLH